MSSFTYDGVLIKNIVAKLSIKKISSAEIIEEVYQKTNETITSKEIYNVRLPTSQLHVLSCHDPHQLLL